ncbi:hypothetical protein FJY94_06165 [Candidatus Kaiserbacteria bacterium]|nr:hypothetical protein [Candidatus Kaiserbacteria bacterium]
MQYSAQYELLRSQVIPDKAARPDLAAQPRGVGLALLLHAGMPEWLKAVDGVIRSALAQRLEDAEQPPPAPEYPTACNSAPPWLSSVQRHTITSLLTSLVLSTRRADRFSPMEGYRSCP